MKLLFKQRFFSWFDSYDIYNEAGETVYTVEGKLSWGHCLHILDAAGNHIGTVKEWVLTLLPKFELYENDEYIGSIQKAFTFFTPKFDIDCNGWQVQGSFMEWDYTIDSASRGCIATITKRGKPRRRPPGADAGAGHRRGEVLQKQLNIQKPRPDACASGLGYVRRFDFETRRTSRGPFGTAPPLWRQRPLGRRDR